MRPLLIDDFDFSYPEELVAQEPLLERDQARLLVAGDSFQHRKVFDLPDLLEPGDLLVLNNTKVIPARIFAHRKSGGRVEIFLLEQSGRYWSALINASKALRDGEVVNAPGDIELVVEDSGYPGLVRFPEGVDVHPYLLKHGLPPLPPYIKRDVRQRDFLQYQTIYAEIPGAVAAPTAGLHFTPRLLEKIDSREIGIEYVTLHVGLGTFQPVRAENIENHIMHAEHYTISPAVWESVERAERVVAVGTTTLRALETAAITDRLSGKTDLFIYPGFDFRVVDKLMTNFHQPRTTLFMLVSAFTGVEKIKAAYKEAIGCKYRLFSYGDAMLLMST